MALDMYSMSDEVNFEDIRQSLTEVRNHLDLLRPLFHTQITSVASLPGRELQELPGKLSPRPSETMAVIVATALFLLPYCRQA